MERLTLYKGYAFKADKSAYIAAYQPATVSPHLIPSVFWEDVIIDDLSGNKCHDVIIDDTLCVVIEVDGEFYAQLKIGRLSG